MKKSLLCLAILSSLTAMASAQTSIEPTLAENQDLTSPSEAIELSDTVVRPDYVEIERLQNTKEILVLTKANLQEAGNRTVTDALSTLPSVNVNTAGRNVIDIRGQGSETASRNLQVLIDGAPITSITSHPFSMSYNVIPVEALERVEVIPGGGSVMYGSGAVGGIVSMTSSLQTLKEPRSSIWGEWNSDGYRAGLTAGTTFADNRGAVEFTGSKIDRDLTFVNTYAKTDYASLGVRWDLTPHQQLILRASHMDEDSLLVNNVSRYKLLASGRDYVPSPIKVTVGVDSKGKRIQETRPGYIHADQRMDMVSLTYRAEANETLSFTNDLFYYQGRYQGDQYDTHEMDIEGYGLRSKANIKYMDDGQLLVGVDLLHRYADLDYTSYDYLKGKYHAVPYDFSYETNTYALYALNTNRWNKWEFNEGVRYELTDWSFSKYGRATEGLGEDETRRRNVALELSAAYHYNDTGRVYARYERGYTLPDGILISDQVSQRINGKKVKIIRATDAKDEVYDLFEVGWREVFPWTTVSATLWYNETRNQASRFYHNDPVNGLSVYTKNLLNTRRWGADLTLTQAIGPVSFEESVAYTMGRTRCEDELKCVQLEQNTQYTDKGLQKVPKWRATLKAKWDITDKLSADVTWMYFGRYANFYKKADVNNDGAFMKSYDLTNLSVKYRPNEHFQLYGGVMNLFDKTYYEYGSTGAGSFQTLVLGADRTFFIGAKAIW